MIIRESILDDLETAAAGGSAAQLAAQQDHTEKVQLTHRVELILKKWQTEEYFSLHAPVIAEGLVTLKRQIRDAMESMSFVRGYEAYFIYGDHQRMFEETLEYGGETVVLEHTEEESRGCFLIDLYFSAPQFKYTYVDRFVKTMFALKTRVPDFYVKDLRVRNMHGVLNKYSAGIIVENDIFTEYYDKQHYVHFLIVMKGFVQETVPLGQWRRYVEKKGLTDEQDYALLSNCTRGDNGTSIVRLGTGMFPVTDDVQRFKYPSMWAKNIARIDGALLIDRQGTFHKSKSDNPDALKQDFEDAVRKYVTHVARSFRLYEGLGGRSYMMYMVFDEPFIFMDVEYVLIYGGWDYQSDDVFNISRILMMFILAGATPEEAVDRYLSKRNDAYPKTLRHDILEILNFNCRKMSGKTSF